MSSCALRPLLRTSNSNAIAHRPTILSTYKPTPPHSRNANLLKRPKRPWVMDQIVILSDGSAYKQLTTSPKGVIRSTKDVRNHPMWNPSIQKLMDVEEDDAGKLSAFRERYGRGFDNKEASAAAAEAAEIVSGKKDDGKKADEEEVDYLMDLISSGYIRPPGGASEKKQGKK